MNHSAGSESPPGQLSETQLRSERHNPYAPLMNEGISPQRILGIMAPNMTLPPDADDMMLWRLIVSMIEPPRRRKLPQFNTIEDAIDLIRKCQNIVVLSGAGISTSAGLPDFRSRDGIYVQIHAEHPDLDDPKAMFDIEYFRRNPLPFYQFAKALYPGQFKPTIGHQFIKCIEDHNKLLRNYSQNIDTLEKQAGIKKVVECHGSFARATCTNCKFSVDGEEIRNDIFEKRVPKCPRCQTLEEGPEDGLGVLKPNIVFFGEKLGSEFHNAIDSDKDRADLLIVIGSSLKVRPVALIPKHISPDVPQILINKEPLDHMEFDIELLGDCDYIIQELCLRLGGDWTRLCESHTKPLVQLTEPSALEIKRNSDKDNNNKQQQQQQQQVSEGGDKQPVEADKAKESATNADQNDDDDDDDWEDVEIIDSPSSSTTSSNSSRFDKLDMKVPEASFLFLRPSRYLFRGAELTKLQYENFTKESQASTSFHE